jgi:hypothetical protein
MMSVVHKANIRMGKKGCWLNLIGIHWLHPFFVLNSMHEWRIIISRSTREQKEMKIGTLFFPFFLSLSIDINNNPGCALLPFSTCLFSALLFFYALRSALNAIVKGIEVTCPRELIVVVVAVSIHIYCWYLFTEQFSHEIETFNVIFFLSLSLTPLRIYVFFSIHFFLFSSFLESPLSCLYFIQFPRVRHNNSNSHRSFFARSFSFSLSHSVSLTLHFDELRWEAATAATTATRFKYRNLISLQ